MLQMKTARLLAENVSALLVKHGYKQTDLAQHCRRSDPWVSQFLRGERSWQLDDLDKVADFFGLNTFELFRPGIAQRTDRRIGQRRANSDRRIGHDVRMARHLSSQLEGARRPKEIPRAEPSPEAEALHRLIADFARRVAPYLSSAEPGGQTADARARGAKSPERRRRVRGSDPKTA